MKFYFARHGQTDWNTLRKVQGTTDIPLNENGIRQAYQLCDYLKENSISFTKIYSSYQTRAVQTAEIAAEQFNTGYETVKGLEEMNLGLFEGHTWDEILSMYAEEFELWQADRRYSTSPGGESYQMVLERVFQVLDYILEQNDAASEGNVLIITHGAVIMTLLAVLRDVPFEQALTIRVDNAVPVVLNVDDLEEIRKKI
ncbi:MAG: histidine phosphatase family protein [Eubacterium sp.]|nr:histidine phosphatase family protein [Eubacterium sp.]